VCEYCGCRQVAPIAELMDEHDALSVEGDELQRALSSGDRERASALLRSLVDHLTDHVRKEEVGLFTAMREQGEFVDEVDALEQEHTDLDEAVAALDPDDPGLHERLAGVLAELGRHIERENLGIFPVSVVSLGARGWDRVDDARTEHPTWLATGRA
jgi:hemerythrin-like domain-containing protein